MTKKKKPAARKTRLKHVGSVDVPVGDDQILRIDEFRLAPKKKTKRLPGQHPKNCLCPYHCEERRAAWRAGHPPEAAPVESGWSDNFKGALLVVAVAAALTWVAFACLS